jgi:hypothetical protein
MLFSSCLYLWALAILAGTTCAYNLKDDYTRNGYADFFDDFSFWTDGDPTNGTVDYVDQQSAWNNGLIGNGGNIYLGVDHANVASGRGRKSVRLTSKATYNPGTLVVADIDHMVRCSHSRSTMIGANTHDSPRLVAPGPRSGQRPQPRTGLKKVRSISWSK